MKRQEFSYELPEELIAQYPTENRTDSRLLVLQKQAAELEHRQFADIGDYLAPGDLLVLNDTRVMPARLFGTKESGGQIEVLIERITGGTRAIAQIRASKAPKAGSRLLLDRDLVLHVVERVDDHYLVEAPEDMSIAMLLQAIGHMPLPPYIDRPDEEADAERYQTVYAARHGAVAAPTAGLHFDQALLDALQQRGIKTAFTTLHVGSGTFQPVRSELVEDHKMHAEYIEVSAELCNDVRETRESGHRVVAVGTTAVRSLETAAGSRGWIEPYYGDTEIFIYPGYHFNIVDAMITNFHLPESTLLMLVSAFAGRDSILNAYREAIAERYRFFSYGDAMLLV